MNRMSENIIVTFASLVLAATCMVFCGCASMGRGDAGAALVESGNYEAAFDYYRAMSVKHPTNPHYHERRQVAARMAARQHLAHARRMLLDGNLDGFLEDIEAAARFQPQGSARRLVDLVRSLRAEGVKDADIVGRIVEDLQGEGLGMPLAAAVRLAAERLAGAVLEGEVGQPLRLDSLTSPSELRSLGVAFEGRLRQELARCSVQLVDRVDVDKIVVEQELQATDRFDADSTIERGRLKGARSLLRGVITRFDDRTARVQLEAVDIETGESVWHASVAVEVL